MRWALAFLDWQGDQIRRVFDAGQNQIRLGVAMVDLGAVLLCGMPLFPSEPPIVYFMSAAALIYAGIGAVQTAVLNVQATEEE